MDDALFAALGGRRFWDDYDTKQLSVMNYVVEWFDADQAVMAARRAMVYNCENYDPGEPETNYPGTPVCRHASIEQNEWCEPCRKQNTVYLLLVAAKRRRKAAVEKLRRVILREKKKMYDPAFGDDRVCRCDHPYYRHFDGYEGNYPVGCKYCPCQTFKEKPHEN